jgi:sugar/nucleoside kinase (ribokinase family)
MINLLESGSANTLSISPSNQYMRPEYLDKLQVIVKGTAVFAPTENQLASLCSSQTDDIWEMMEIITDLGCQRVVVSRGMKGYLMFDAASKKRYHLPVYPNRWVNPTGAEDVFAGAFLSELTATYDASRALVWGCAMASIAVEGSGPFYCLEAIPGLADARAMKLQSYLGSV